MFPFYKISHSCNYALLSALIHEKLVKIMWGVKLGKQTLGSLRRFLLRGFLISALLGIGGTLYAQAFFALAFTTELQDFCYTTLLYCHI